MPGPIVGVDEVGLGPWAGPLVACAFAAPDESWRPDLLNDSKKLSATQRAIQSRRIMRAFPNAFELVWVSPEEIDRLGLGEAHLQSLRLAIERLIERVGVPWRVIVDGVRQPVLGAECYPKADGLFPCVMAASVIAKVARDDFMMRQAALYPAYGFESHMGYGVPRHQEALRVHGVCPLHRRSFAPIQRLLGA